MRRLPNHSTPVAQAAQLATAPAASAPLLRRTTQQQQHEWEQQRWWRKLRLLGACPPRATLARMMRNNRGVAM